MSVALSLGSVDAAEPAPEGSGKEPSAEPEARPTAPPIAPQLLRARRFLLGRAKQRFEAWRRAGATDPHQLLRSLDAVKLAYTLAPASWLLFNMGLVEYELGHCAQARELYEELLRNHPRPLERADAESGLLNLDKCEPHGDVEALQVLEPEAPFVAAPPPFAPRPMALVESNEPRGADGDNLWLSGSVAWLAVMSGTVAGGYWLRALSAKRDLERQAVAGPRILTLQRRGESAQSSAVIFSSVAVGLSLGAVVSYLLVDSEASAPEARADRLAALPVERGAVVRYSTEF